ncbi:hypothetical protein SEUCBS139899_006024 [Sporothrix eucalyptigena]|uniref:Uncharacterized protein n=1 Tax=Sporothrix eucalyptigena TaxID=1812306 RepID=A0ABP0CXV8_9PEZI
MASVTAPPATTSIDDSSLPKEAIVQTTEVQPDEDIQLTARQLFCFWDAVTHCAEPQDYKGITEMFKKAVEEEDNADNAPGQDEPAVKPAEAPAVKAEPKYHVLTEFEMEFQQNRYQIGWSKKKPARHSSWPTEFVLVVNNDDPNEPYFQVFKTQLESLIINTQDPEPTSQAWPEYKRDPDRLVYQFGRKYVYGPASLDEEGTPRIGHYAQKNFYNYAEHAIIGNRLRLLFAEDERTVAGDRPLVLENGNRLTYGQINGLGGDFFATNNPICTGADFEQQCQFFLDAYNLLGKAESGSKEAPLIDRINEREMKAVSDAIHSGKSAKQVYKDLGNNDPSSVKALPISGTDEQLTKATMERDGPSYARMALLNLDHFGNDAHIAYNAGHTCAMRAAAGGNLEIGYAMNAFADHYLGDCFASGHIRTPRRTLHAPASAIEKVCGIINDIYQEVTKGMNAKTKAEAALRGAKDSVVLPYMAAKLAYHASDIMAIAPDVCSKFMHDEDNKRGLIVVNKRGDRWAAFGDTMLFEPSNAQNFKFMQEALQASADEVYQAYVTKKVPTDVNSFAAWNIAPSGIDEQHCHRPLFTPNGHYRTKYTEPWSNEYSDPKSWTPSSWKPWDIPMDYPRLMKNLSGDDYFKNL